MAEMVRINTRISADLNEYLDNLSDSTGMAKSTIVMLAIEDYRKSREVIAGMSDLNTLYEKLERIEQQIK
jgi:predicted DNA-binding protein